MDIILFVIVSLDLILLCLMFYKELCVFFKNRLLPIAGIISVIDLLWNFIERIFKTVDLIIDSIFNFPGSPPPINDDSFPIFRIKTRIEEIEDRLRASGEAPPSTRRTRQ